MEVAKRLSDLVEEKRETYIWVNDEIWKNPELGYREDKASKILMDVLAENGFKVESNLAGIPTAFKGVYGNGKPVVGFLAEYDALAGLSQESGIAECKPIVEGGAGHGCGHNALGAGTLAAAVALKEYMEENNTPGTIIFYGCPAEEMGCGKAFMTREGVFDEIDVALAWHPADSDTIVGTSALANIQVEFAFEGVSAHASSMPHLGRSALDAAELMNVGVQFLREHIIQEARIHYAFLDVGGISPNVVQNSSRLFYYIRAPKAEQCQEIFARVQDIAKGAALMTGTKTKTIFKCAMLDLVQNDTLGNAMAESWKEVGSCQFSDEAHAIAEKMSHAIPGTKAGPVLSSKVPAYVHINKSISGSTDVGDVSYVVPTVVAMVTTLAKGSPSHSWQRVAQGATAVTHEGMLHAGKVLARTALRVLEDPELVEKAKEEHKRVVGDSRPCLIPEDVMPGQI